MKKFELSITSDYASQWGLQEAVREIIQNAIDQSAQVQGNDMSIDYNGSNLYISNKKSSLSKKSLLLGYSSKADDNKTIGKFGEGYKIALLVLTRMGYETTIYNYAKKEVWTARFVKSRRYEGEKVLTIFVDTAAIWKKVPNNNLTIEIKNITPEDFKEIRNRTLQLQDIDEDCVLGSSRGRILLDEKHKGKIFVNGLYVTTLDSFTKGYDILPQYLSIGRDRDLVSDFDISFSTSAMWLDQDPELTSEMVSGKDSLDEVRYIGSVAYTNPVKSEILGEVLHKDLSDEYGKNAYPVSNHEEFERIGLTYSNAKPVFVSTERKELILNSSSFMSNISVRLDKKEVPVGERYKMWCNKYSFRLPTEAIEELDEIIDKLSRGGEE